jgi:MFS family permease
LRTKQFWFLCIAWALNSFFFQVGMVHIVPYATDLGMSAIAAATILTVIGLLGAMGRVSLGFAGDRFGNRATLIACSMLVAAVYLGLFASRTVWMLYLFAVVFGFFGSVLNLLTPMVAEFFGLKALGTIAGAVMTAIGIGGAVGPVVAGRIFDTNGTYNPAFILCGTLAIITGITLWALKPNLFKRRTEYN